MSSTTALATRTILLSIFIAIPAVFLAGYSGGNSYLTFLSKHISTEEELSPPFMCQADRYSTEIISLDPVIIYINNFVSDAETKLLITSGEQRFQPSEVFRNGQKQQHQERTSQTVGLPDDEAAKCVKARARRFLGTLFDDAKDDIGWLQLVKYEAGQRFDLHQDFYDSPQPDSSGRNYNRIASFFAFLQDNCTEGETYFPYVTPMHSVGVTQGDSLDQYGRFRAHENGGVAFKPIRGNALFWMNLATNGTGDSRVRHAGLPLGEGTKIAMNIWPRKYYD